MEVDAVERIPFYSARVTIELHDLIINAYIKHRETILSLDLYVLYGLVIIF